MSSCPCLPSYSSSAAAKASNSSSRIAPRWGRSSSGGQDAKLARDEDASTGGEGGNVGSLGVGILDGSRVIGETEVRSDYGYIKMGAKETKKSNEIRDRNASKKSSACTPVIVDAYWKRFCLKSDTLRVMVGASSCARLLFPENLRGKHQPAAPCAAAGAVHPVLGL